MEKPRLGFSLVPWWLRRLHRQVCCGIANWWREAEWPLLVVGCGFLLSFVLHLVGYQLAKHQVGWPKPFFAPTEWEGRTGWRKPIVFGISNAMIFISLREALRSQTLVQRHWAAHVAAWSTALEVSVITLQAWRGVPSHFNVETSLDLFLYIVKLFGVSLLAAVCFGVTAGFLLRPCNIAPAKATALRHGLALLSVAALIGFAQVIYGHVPRAPQNEETALCLYVTAGATGSPCYEIYGQSVIKLAHFMPLHATESLLLLAWAVAQAPHCNLISLVRIAAGGHWVLTLLSFWTVASGEPFKWDPRPCVAAIACFGSAAIVIPFIAAAVAPCANAQSFVKQS
eukprot:gnl/MRDRNA2_/MRDRNA2_131391_c0_seq1.p1 gnl/MRDRNA2_/MRDRNA2_131391_c0~~gnl/MRDRNA2_/MRDRNA2_131391_c0_seq1.p1  ORF type:complete len:341 (-),score=43.55 gnl/MRDRNA2_/MRDRNA2_131391_c0_seq1:121-1143(-)